MDGVIYIDYFTRFTNGLTSIRLFFGLWRFTLINCRGVDARVDYVLRVYRVAQACHRCWRFVSFYCREKIAFTLRSLPLAT